MTDNTTLLESIRRTLYETLGESGEIKWIKKLAGGDINQAALISSGNTRWFLKYHQNAPVGLFAAEAQALMEISQQDCIRVPTPVTHGQNGKTAWLLLEYLELGPDGPHASLGEQLAAMHAVTYPQHGWSRDNYIGTTLQRNTCNADWSVFWRDNRLKPQLEMARTAGYGRSLLNNGERLLDCIDQLMDGHQPAASLLHGDLWAGNKAFTAAGQAVIFDPASYYGDRETDIAMTELFGGFGVDFYAAYRAHRALPEGYHVRRDLYNLYHMLNHLNLFGAGWSSRCEQLIGSLLAQIS